MTIEFLARIAFLKRIHLFHDLTDGELASIAEKLQEAPYAAGSVIFEQGKRPESFYLIYEGGVRITRKQDRKEIQLARLVKDDYFGEMGLIGKRLRSGTAIALTDVSLFVMSREDFEKFYKGIPQLRLNFDLAIKSRQLARKLQFTWLRPDEVIYFLARKHPVVLYQRLIWPLFGLFVPIFLFYAWFAIAKSTIVLVAGFVSLIAIALWILWYVIDWENDYYIVTNKRVVWLEKVIGIYESRQESPLNTILSVAVETTQLGRILDYGDVIVRTWVGRIPFNDVRHPEQAQDMIEEYWQRTKEQAVGMEKEAMRDAIRRRLGIPVPLKPKPDPVIPVEKPPQPQPRKGLLRLLRMLGAGTLMLRYEAGDSVFYRKHWFVLIQQAWMSLAGIIAAIILFFWRLIRLAQSPEEAFIQIVNGALVVDVYSLAVLIALVPLLGWLIYEVMDWSNDQFQVTPEQIVDLDRKPFGTQTRNAAQLENILGTEYQRIGILGEIFNYGTVYITVGGSRLAFEDVIDPASVQSDIDRRREARKSNQDAAKIAAERERMAEWLATYHMNADALKKEEEEKNQKPE
ncbi:MAG TPA: cyclic nucleotide-binding domain-containing protein [Anaerolineales bacterium]|nr:cyclic nucleotide-binding domain-containing protein [Anaerolineales bacterium]